MADLSKVDLINNSITNTLLTSFISSSNTFTKQLTTVLLMSSIEELRKIIGDFFTYVRSNYSTIIRSPLSLAYLILDGIKYILCYFPLHFIKFLNIRNIFNIKNIKKVQNPMVNFQQPIPYTPITSTKIKMSPAFFNSLVQYIKSHEKEGCQLRFDDEFSTKIANRHEITVTKKLNGFKLIFEDMIINSCDHVSINIDLMSGTIINNSVISDEPNSLDWTRPLNHQIKSFVDLLPRNSTVYKFIKHYSDKYTFATDDTEGFYSWKPTGNVALFRTEAIFNMVHTLTYYSWLAHKTANINKNLINKNQFNFELTVFMAYSANKNCGLVEHMSAIVPGKMNIMFNQKPYPIKWESQYPIDNLDYLKSSSTFPPSILDMVDSNEYQQIYKYLFSKDSSDSSKLNGSGNEIGSGNDFNLSIENYNEIAYKNLVNVINNQCTILGDKVKIYQVTMTNNVIETFVPNPEWTRINNFIKENAVPIPNVSIPNVNEHNIPNDSNILRLKQSLLDIPEKISHTVIERKMNVKYITEKYKSINTLYLRERNYNELFNFLNMYKNNRKTMTEYGLPDKLGVFLHGLPGTGKTSTIIAIASFLKKDIYYVDLKTIETDEEVTSVFNHINDVSANGGIVVIEDIDAMTDIVLDRSNINMGDVRSSSKVTLAHLLNILQGSLTKDGTIFIVTTNHKKHLDPAFVRAGRFDIEIEMKNADRYQCKQIYKTFIKRDLSDEILSLLPEDTFSPAKFIFYIAKRLWQINDDDRIIIDEFLTETE